MPYIGNDVQFGELTSETFTGDGSTVAFTMAYTIANTTSILVTSGNVVQEPTVAYTVSGTTLTFTSAPADDDTIHVRYLGRTLDVGQTAIVQDADQDTKIQVEESADEDIIRFDVAGAEVATLTNSALTLKGTTPTLTIGDAGAEDTKIVFDGNAQDYYIGLDDGTDDLLIGLGSAVGTTPAISIDENVVTTINGGLDLSAVSGIVEANANFIDMCLVGPSVDGKSWNGHFSNGAVWTSLMLATVETSGSDAQLNIWDLTAGTLASATPLATLTLTGATPTSIAASMGYLIVGTSDQGFHIVDPHTGAWAERTEGALKTLSTSTGPALADNNVFDVAIQMPDNGSPQDPNTGGLVPFISWTYGASADECGILNNGAVYNKTEGTATDNVTAIDSSGYVFTTNNSSDYGRKSNVPIYQILADDWGASIFFDGSGAAGPTFTGAQGDANSISLGPDGKIVTATDAGLNYGYTHANYAGSDLAGYVTRAFTTGYLGQGCKIAALANSVTADRSGNANTLTENGTVVEAAVASGAELKGYSDWSSSNYMSRAYDADFDFGVADWSAILWFKIAANGAAECLFDRDDGTFGTSNPYWALHIEASGELAWAGSGASASWNANTGGSGYDYDDGIWHMAACVNEGAASQKLYIDGGLVASTTVTIGTVSNGDAVLYVGERPDASRPLTDGTLALLRFSASAPTATQVRRMYEAEAPMYTANAKVLLQSGSTDAVLDAKIDPLSGKVIVTQTDSQEIFDGLAIETERTVATGGSTFEHGLLWGDAVAEINNANLFASTPATDQRQVNEMVRSLSADLPAGADMSKAKAWVRFNGSGTIAIATSYNVESLTDNGTGDYTVNWAVPFKTINYVVQVSANVGAAGFNGTSALTTGSVQLAVETHAGSRSDAAIICVSAFGELENE